MTDDIEPQVQSWSKLGGINTEAATHHSESIENVRQSLDRPYLQLRQLPDFNKSKGGLPIALAAGGPSIKQTIDELREYHTIVACGSAHDWLIENGIVPKYCVVCDPDAKITANYLRTPHPECIYLIATQCHESVFKAVEKFPVVMWHCYSQEHAKLLDEREPGWNAVAGGCTAGLRAVSIAIMLGYSNIHFFGFDSCLGADEAHHAYEFTDPSEEVGKVFGIKMGEGSPGEKLYLCSGYQLAQAVHFKQFLNAFAHVFTPTFHGEGMLTDMCKDIYARAAEMNKLEKVA